MIANFAYGVLARLGIAWQNLESVNPRLILLSMTGFGDSGPERDYVAYGVTQEELCGIYSLTGYEGEGPLKSGPNIGDPMNGLHGVIAILAALHERNRTGRGQYIELSQYESSIGFIGEFILDYVVNGRVAQPVGNAHPFWAPHGIYPARGDDQWVAIVARSEDDWQRVLAVLGADDLGRETRFQNLAARLAHRAELDRELARWTVAWEREELAVALQAQGVPAAPVLTSLEVQEHPHYVRRGFLPTLTHPDGGQYRAGARLGGHSPNNLFPTGDGQFIHIAAAGATVFVRLAILMGRKDLLSDSRFNTPQGRNEHWQPLDEIVTQWCTQYPLDALEKMLHEAEVPATRVSTMADIFKDAHYRAREMLITVHDDDLGPLTHPAVVPKLSGTPGRVHWSGRRLGQDTRHVLTEMVGLPAVEVERLEAAGVLLCDHSESRAGTDP